VFQYFRAGDYNVNADELAWRKPPGKDKDVQTFIRTLLALVKKNVTMETPTVQENSQGKQFKKS